MTKFEAMVRIFVTEIEREAEQCLPFLLSTLRPLERKFFDTLEAAVLAREKLRYGCSYWHVRDMLLFGVRTGALEFLDGRFRLKDTSARQDVNVKAWRKSIVQILRLKKMTRNLEFVMAGRSPEYRIRQARQAAVYNPAYDPREIYRSIFGEKMRRHGQHWPNIDLPFLKSVNPDTVGWLYLAKSPINYPVVRAREDYYLRVRREAA